MKDIVKPAFIRWLTDLMKADNIVALDEIEYLEEVCQDYSISQLDIEKSLSLSLADACNIILEHSRKRERTEILNKLKGLSLSDGACAREEALLILALSYCLDDTTKDTSSMISFKSAHIDFTDSQVLFIEPHEDEVINGMIQLQFKSILNEMRIGGFDFIYIPSIAEHYRRTNKPLLRNIIKYLAPTLSDNETHNVLEVISNMTTKYFKNEILREKLGINIIVKKPSIMIKIGNSTVNGEHMSDFLLLEIEHDILKQIETLITTFLDYQRCPTITIKNYTDAGGNFVYTGFYKTVFDLITYRKGARSTLLINPDGRKGRLKILEAVESNLEMGLGETAFYVFLICESLSKRKGVSFINQGVTSLNKIQERYANVYSAFVGAREKAPDITDGNTRNRMLSVIRNAIRDNDVLSEKRLFMPNTNTSKIFVAVDPQLIYVRDGKKNKLLMECSTWKIDH